MMKIKKEHYEHMKSTIDSFVSEQLPAIKTHYCMVQEEGKAKDINTRMRFDIMTASKLTSFVCDTVYPYANDNHVDTALRNILPDSFFETLFTE